MAKIFATRMMMRDLLAVANLAFCAFGELWAQTGRTDGRTTDAFRNAADRQGRVI